MVKAIEENGIGRPSTYATIIGTLTKRKYITRSGKYLVPTPIAFAATDLLMKYFSDIMDIKFTAKMETRLDDIAEAGADWHKVVKDYYDPIMAELKAATQDNEEKTDIKCPDCGEFMVKKSGRFGEYLFCHKCNKSHNMNEKESDVKCPNCGANMILKEGKYGKYLACPNAACGTKMQEGDVVSDQKCPSCGGITLLKTGKFGKYLKCTKCGATKSLNEYAGICPKCHKPTQKMTSKKGTVYYGCSGYPACDFISWDEPTGEMCPTCGKYLIKKDGKVRCSDKKCNYHKD